MVLVTSLPVDSLSDSHDAGPVDTDLENREHF